MSIYKYIILYVSVVCAVVSGETCYAQKFALLIGVDYPAPNTLDYTRTDAIALGNVLKKNFGFQIKQLTTPEETTRKRLMKEFSILQKSQYNQVIVFFSGHGIQDTNSKEVGYLLPQDYNKSDKGTGF